MLTPALRVFWNPRPAWFSLEYNFDWIAVHLPLWKRVDKLVLPLLFVGGQFGLGKQTIVEHRDKSFPIHATTNKHNLLTAVTVAILPDPFNMTTVLGPVVAGDGSPEITRTLVPRDSTGLRSESCALKTGCQPEHSFRPNDTRPFALQAVIESLRMKRDSPLVNKITDPVFLGLGCMLDE